MTVSLLEEKGYDPLVYRLFCLQSHYRKGLVFSWENLDNAKTAYDKLVARVAALDEGGELDQEAMEPFRAAFKAFRRNVFVLRLHLCRNAERPLHRRGDGGNPRGKLFYLRNLGNSQRPALREFRQ